MCRGWGSVNHSGGRSELRGSQGRKAPILRDVKGLYSKRPIQCLASSKYYWPPIPSPSCKCVPPAYSEGGGHTRWVERGSIFWKTPDTALYSTYLSTLCLERYTKKIFWANVKFIFDFLASDWFPWICPSRSKITWKNRLRQNNNNIESTAYRKIWSI